MNTPFPCVPNATLFNCCTDWLPPDFSAYDATEVMPVYVDPEGNCDVCLDAPELAVIWSVYGHLPAGGVECITDVTTKHMALAIAALFDRVITPTQA